MLDKSEGIVIRTIPYGESHIIVKVYTKERGKIALMAKGAKKPKSQFAAIAQPYAHAYFTFYYRQSMSTLSQGEMLHSFRHLRENLDKGAYAAYLLELLDAATEEHVPSPATFSLILSMLGRLRDGDDPDVIKMLFELKMTHLLGIRPQLDACVNCGRTSGVFSFSVREAGFLCHHCIEIDPYRYTLDDKQVKLLRMLYYVKPDQLGQLALNDQNKSALKTVIDGYYESYAGLNLKTKRFLDQWVNWNPELPK
ncbi:DNA repair protein RecO [Geomicrobium sp. JCM 19038]|uniref:DNA repair protein RecO n=1 Tax=Geomicrobium sp. JCM 19038 TaxID=1460635 RepID=UPI00045F2BC6|nr:DNA repair protein RecO [Geomicrobium sp. JCM 19038]GAK06443.1 DNA recombination and repair protein RecO [Geomicrobium sp. JCM 19038]